MRNNRPTGAGNTNTVTTPTAHPQNLAATLRRLLYFALAAVALVAVLASCDTPLTTFEPRSDATQRVHTIYIFVIVAASIVGFLVLAAMAYILWKYRERPGHTAQQIHGNTTLEITWTVIPILILVAIAAFITCINIVGGFSVTQRMLQMFRGGQ